MLKKNIALSLAELEDSHNSCPVDFEGTTSTTPTHL